MKETKRDLNDLSGGKAEYKRRILGTLKAGFADGMPAKSCHISSNYYIFWFLLIALLLAFCILLVLSGQAHAWDSYSATANPVSNHFNLTDRAITLLLNQYPITYPDLSQSIYRNALACSNVESKPSQAGSDNEATHSNSHFPGFITFPDLSALSAYNLCDFATGNNPGSNYPEWWWQSAVREYRFGSKDLAYFYLGSLTHLIADQAVPAHAYYIMHGGEDWEIWKKDQFEIMGLDNWYPDWYKWEWIELHDETHEILEQQNSYKEVFSEYLCFKPYRIRLKLACDSEPIFNVRVEYENETGSEAVAYAVDLTSDQTIEIEDDFKQGSLIKVYYSSFGDGDWGLWPNEDVDFYLEEDFATNVLTDIYTDPDYENPWQYYEWLRKRTVEVTNDPYWNDYYEFGQYPGDDDKFDLTWSSGCDRHKALLSIQQDLAAIAIKWALKSAGDFFNDPTKGVDDAFNGMSWKVVFYEDPDFNYKSSDDDTSPEYKKSVFFYGSLEGQTDYTFAVNDIGSYAPYNEQGCEGVVFTPKIAGEISAVEIIAPRGNADVKVTLYKGTNLTGEQRVLTSTESLSGTGFNNEAQSFKIEAKETQKPTITNNQSGDDIWRNTNNGTYNVDFVDGGGSHLSKFQVSKDGTDWTDVATNINADFYTDNWQIPQSFFDDLPQGETNIDVRVYDNAGNVESFFDVFYIRKDTIVPTDPVISSPSHWVGVWSNDNTIDIDLSGAADDTSGVDAFSIEWSSSDSTVPDDIADIEETENSATSDLLADGAWYAHLRTKDNAGNWTSTVHLGPFYIDTQDPDITNNQSGDDIWRNTNNGTYNVDFADGGGSHLSKFQVSKDGTDWTDVATNINADFYTDNWQIPQSFFDDLPQGETNIDVRVYDNAGNVESFFDVFYIRKDTVGPSTPVLNGTAIDPIQIDLSWTPSIDLIGVSGYRIYDADDHTQIDQTAATSFSFTNLIPGEDYNYYIKAYDGLGNESTASNTVSITTPAPAVPSGIDAKVGDMKNTLTWDSVAYADYKVYRKAFPLGSFELITPTSVSGTSYIDEPGVKGVYCYRVTSVINEVEGGQSSDIVANYVDMVKTVTPGGETLDALNGTVKIVIPDSTLSNDTDISVIQEESPPPAPSGLQFASPVFDFGSSGSSFDPDKPVTITIKYNNGVVDPLNKLDVYWHDGSGWRKITTARTVNIANQTISIQTDHFTPYVVMSSGSIIPTGINAYWILIAGLTALIAGVVLLKGIDIQAKTY